MFLTVFHIDKQCKQPQPSTPINTINTPVDLFTNRCNFEPGFTHDIFYFILSWFYGFY